MAVNFLLTEARDVPPGDPLGRCWVGWKATETDDQLWEVNRGLWSLGSRVDGERIATLSFDGRVQVVADINGRTRHDVEGVTKWALTGRVLHPGDRVHNALKGAPAPRHRNPVNYFDTAALESMPAAEAPGSIGAMWSRWW